MCHLQTEDDWSLECLETVGTRGPIQNLQPWIHSTECLPYNDEEEGRKWVSITKTHAGREETFWGPINENQESSWSHTFSNPTSPFITNTHSAKHVGKEVLIHCHMPSQNIVCKAPQEDCLYFWNAYIPILMVVIFSNLFGSSLLTVRYLMYGFMALTHCIVPTS